MYYMYIISHWHVATATMQRTPYKRSTKRECQEPRTTLLAPPKAGTPGSTEPLTTHQKRTLVTVRLMGDFYTLSTSSQLQFRSATQ